MNARTAGILLDTQLEYRDGAKWVSGRCSFCDAHVAIAAEPDGTYPRARCRDCGSELRVTDERSKGREHAAW